MTYGYMGRLLFVDLSAGTVTDEPLDEQLCKDYVGGYGFGSRILYTRQKGGVDPLGPEAMLGFLTGPLTGTPAPFGARFCVVGKSPLTGGWGDSNCGGYFGPYLKFAGYDGVFFSGIAPKPVYLLIDNGRAELKDASSLWGKGTYETEDTLIGEYGKDASVVSIGPAGEKVSLCSCIITSRGDAAGRSGLGAVMGVKKLKAIVARGNMTVPVHDLQKANELRRQQISEDKEFLKGFGTHGTASHGDISAHSGDTPVRNWGGIGVIDIPDVSGLHKDAFMANLDKRKGCWHCPVACKASLKAGIEYPYPAGNHRVEYETMGAFGANCSVTNAEAVNMASHFCNDYGFDTISGGSIISFCMELYENGIITSQDTEGIELNWGNHQAMVAMTEKMVKREGFGAVIADGVKVAAERIGNGAEAYAVHIGGQELGMHDPKAAAFMGGINTMAMYHMDATPGRHTTGFGPGYLLNYVSNAAGLCMHGNVPGNGLRFAAEFLKAVTGRDRSEDELKECGERIAIIRHAFSLREGDNPLLRYIHPRIPGIPPQEDGPLTGVTRNVEGQAYWNLGALDWDMVSTKPSLKRLNALGMDELADELYPPKTD